MTESFTFKQWVLVKQIGEKIDLDSTFKLREKKFEPSELGEDGVLVKSLYLSNDPAQRTWISADIPEDRHYTEPVKAGDVMKAGVLGEVIESKNSEYKKGDLVYGAFGWTEYAVVKSPMRKVPKDMKPEEYVALGLTGLTAYFGLFNAGSLTSKDKTVLVSAAAGATGSTAIQIAKNALGCKRVIGLAGTAEKCKVLKENGADVALNYKDEDFEEQLIKATPEYIDVYFDNVGGKILDLAVERIARNGRIISCGAISTYDSDGGSAISAKSYFKIISMRARIQGFIVLDFMDEWDKASKELYGWVKEGKLNPLNTVWETDFEEVPQGMLKLMKGDNLGKLVTKLKV